MKQTDDDAAIRRGTRQDGVSPPSSSRTNSNHLRAQSKAGGNAVPAGLDSFAAEAEDAGKGDRAGSSAAKARGGFTVSLKGRALRMLTRREYSRAELEKKLAPHESTPGELAAMLDDLQAKDFISEARVVESVINRRASRFGSARIRHELQQKGLDAGRVAGAVQQLKETEVARALDVWRRKFQSGRQGDENPPALFDAQAAATRRAKQMRFLAARGFSGDVIAKVMRAANSGEDES